MRILDIVQARRSIHRYKDRPVQEGYKLVVLIPVGYPARVPAPPPRRELREFVHKDRFRSPSRSAVR